MSDIVDRLRNVARADVRVIAHLVSFDFTVEYIRDDLESEYSNRDLDEAYRTIMGAQVSGDDFKNVIGRDFEAQVLFFEDIVVFMLPSARYEAIFASFDRHEDLPINELIDVATGDSS